MEPSAELLQAGRSLQRDIKRLEGKIWTLTALHGLRLGIARAKADALPQPPPEGAFYLILPRLPASGSGLKRSSGK
jgi:hypothetical protein